MKILGFRDFSLSTIYVICGQNQASISDCKPSQIEIEFRLNETFIKNTLYITNFFNVKNSTSLDNTRFSQFHFVANLCDFATKKIH